MIELALYSKSTEEADLR